MSAYFMSWILSIKLPNFVVVRVLLPENNIIDSCIMLSRSHHANVIRSHYVKVMHISVILIYY